jgi:hypothetical protein
MRKLGYHDLMGPHPNFELPNTTLWKWDSSTDQATKDLKAACLSAKTALLRSIAALVIPGDFVLIDSSKKVSERVAG